MIDALLGEHRLVLRASLRPLAGSAFQPTGFPDLGPAEFQRPDGVPALLVESVQSMANRLEEASWDASKQRPLEPLSGLPWIEVSSPDGVHLTSSREEPHRVAGSYVRDARVGDQDGIALINERFGLAKGRPLDYRRIYREILALDPMCLLHGAFFSDREWHGNPKVRRAVSAVIEAHGVQPVPSGGVKRDDVDPTVESGEGARQTTGEGYGFVPFARIEYTAKEIVLDAVVDVAQIRGYGLPEGPTRALLAAALWELRSLLDNPLRLRTACDLERLDLEVRRPIGFELPELTQLEPIIVEGAAQIEGERPLRMVWTHAAGKSKAKDAE